MLLHFGDIGWFGATCLNTCAPLNQSQRQTAQEICYISNNQEESKEARITPVFQFAESQNLDLESD